MTVGRSEQANTFVVDKDLNVRSIVGCVPKVTCTTKGDISCTGSLKASACNLLSVSSTFRTSISNNHENIQFVEQNNTTVLRCLVECNLHKPELLMYREELEWSQK